MSLSQQGLQQLKEFDKYCKKLKKLKSKDKQTATPLKLNRVGGILPLHEILEYNQTNLRHCNLSRSDLSGTNLSKIEFSKAKLNEVNLNDSNLSRTWLEEADLRGASLLGAALNHASLNSAIINPATQFDYGPSANPETYFPEQASSFLTVQSGGAGNCDNRYTAIDLRSQIIREWLNSLPSKAIVKFSN